MPTLCILKSVDSCLIVHFSEQYSAVIQYQMHFMQCLGFTAVCLHFTWLQIRWAINCHSLCKVVRSSVSLFGTRRGVSSHRWGWVMGSMVTVRDMLTFYLLLKCFDEPISLFDVDYSRILPSSCVFFILLRWAWSKNSRRVDLLRSCSRDLRSVTVLEFNSRIAGQNFGEK